MASLAERRLTLSLLFSLLARGVTSSCEFRGHCANDADTDKAIPCAVHQDAVALETPTSWQAFADLCPQLAAEIHPDRKVCCDVSQVEDLARELEQPARLGMAKCPGCMLNFRDFLCRMTCSPKQSDFLAVNATAREGIGPHVVEMIYAVREEFAQGVYDSCKDVRSVVLGIKLMTLMCGGRVFGCSPQRWLEFLGSTAPEGGYSPFKIHYVLTGEPAVRRAGRNLTPLSAPFLKTC
ncbi:unnamed protein product [Ixodes pacificus]